MEAEYNLALNSARGASALLRRYPSSAEGVWPEAVGGNKRCETIV